MKIANPIPINKNPNHAFKWLKHLNPVNKQDKIKDIVKNNLVFI
jgi:hypothetical protein